MNTCDKERDEANSKRHTRKWWKNYDHMQIADEKINKNSASRLMVRENVELLWKAWHFWALTVHQIIHITRCGTFGWFLSYDYLATSFNIVVWSFRSFFFSLFLLLFLSRPTPEIIIWGINKWVVPCASHATILKHHVCWSIMEIAILRLMPGGSFY